MADTMLLEDGSSKLLEDGVSFVLLEDVAPPATVAQRRSSSVLGTRTGTRQVQS